MYAEAASQRTYTWDEIHPAYRQDYGNSLGTVIKEERDREDDIEEKDKEEQDNDDEEEKDDRMMNEEKDEARKEDKDRETDEKEEIEDEDDHSHTIEPIDKDIDNVRRVNTVMSPSPPPDIALPLPFPPSPNIDSSHPPLLHYTHPPSYLSIPDTTLPLPFPPSPNIPISHLHFAHPPPHLDVSDMVPLPPLPLKPNLSHMFYCRRPRTNVAWRGPGVCRHLSYFISHIPLDDLPCGLIVSVFLLVPFPLPHYTLPFLYITVFGSELFFFFLLFCFVFFLFLSPSHLLLLFYVRGRTCLGGGQMWQCTLRSLL
jgi:hypothetical protein